jgi:hypothetical protein
MCSLQQDCSIELCRAGRFGWAADNPEAHVLEVIFNHSACSVRDRLHPVAEPSLASGRLQLSGRRPDARPNWYY